MSTDTPIFIIGTGRSGTTLLRFMLCAHPRIYITHEASFYVWERQYSRRAPRREFVEFYLHTFSFRWLQLDPERILAGLPDPLPADQLRDVFVAVMRAAAARYGRVRFGDKTPSHAASLARIFADFPDARVIHIARDPRATAQSLARMPWASRSLYANAVYCELEWRAVQKWRDRILMIRLEDLLAEPRETMTRVLDHVGEPWDDAVLDHPSHIPSATDMPPFPWLESAARARSAPTVAWAGLSPLETRMIESIASRLMAGAGYERATLDVEPSALAVWWSKWRQVPEAVRFALTYWRVGRLLRDPRNIKQPLTDNVFRRLNAPSWALYPGLDRMPQPPPE